MAHRCEPGRLVHDDDVSVGKANDGTGSPIVAAGSAVPLPAVSRLIPRMISRQLSPAACTR
jgi:hypothetical protein